jgi:hypothetical protein
MAECLLPPDMICAYIIAIQSSGLTALKCFTFWEWMSFRKSFRRRRTFLGHMTSSRLSTLWCPGFGPEGVAKSTQEISRNSYKLVTLWRL